MIFTKKLFTICHNLIQTLVVAFLLHIKYLSQTATVTHKIPIKSVCNDLWFTMRNCVNFLVLPHFRTLPNRDA